MYPCPNNGTFLLFAVSLGALWSRPFWVLAPLVPACLRFTGSSAVPQGRCLWKHKQSFICRVLQIMCALVQNRLCCLKSALSEFCCSTSEAVPTITGQEREGHGASCRPWTRSTAVRGWRAPERREARLGPALGRPAWDGKRAPLFRWFITLAFLLLLLLQSFSFQFRPSLPSMGIFTLNSHYLKITF